MKYLIGRNAFGAFTIISLLIVMNSMKPICPKWEITKGGKLIRIKSGMLERDINLSGQNIATSELLLDGEKMNKEVIEEFQVTFMKAFPNEEPEGIEFSLNEGVEQTDQIKNQTDALDVIKKNNKTFQEVQWIDSLRISKTTFSEVFNKYSYQITKLNKNIRHLTITFSSDKVLRGVSVKVNYEIYNGYPAIRKWVNFYNQGNQWIKISNLVLEHLQLTNKYQRNIRLTSGTRVDPSIQAFCDSTASTGIIAVCEIPSKLRCFLADGTIGYNPNLFEWVIGPGESFESEAVLIYAFSGETYPTVSAVSTALDRCVENRFHSFLNEHILRPVGNSKNIAPLFCTWTNYNAAINEINMRAAADVASRIGFKCFQLDAGWSDNGLNAGWAVSSPNPNITKFPDLKGLSSYVHSKNMKMGLWYSVFINEKQAMESDNEPVLFSLPIIRRSGGLGLSMCYKKSREKYVDDILYLHRTYQVDYFKQDLSNVCYGDIAKGHESRTLKESYLRGLRGLFTTQDHIHQKAPQLWLQLSHEIYWETPGIDADVAVLKHADSYHIPPNEYWGAGNRSKLVSVNWKYNVDSLRNRLIQGAFRARDLLYANRGLPLDRLEVFGAVTTNYYGSLSPEVQDRQICSWLMGAPLSFSGDLGSLTKDNIERYSSRFAILENLQQRYKIYSCFQYSGVPAPTDVGWHWWGKLNNDGSGAVVVLRGNSGPEIQKINIPWVIADKIYKVKTLFSGNILGEYTGQQLIAGELEISLNPLGQEIIELTIK